MTDTLDNDCQDMTEKIEQITSKLKKIKKLKKDETLTSEVLKELQSCEKDLNVLIEKNDSQKLKEILAINYLEIATFYPETETPIELLMKCIDLLNEKGIDRGTICTNLVALNLLGAVWYVKGNSEKALDCLIKAEQMFIDYTSNKDYEIPLYIDAIFSDIESNDQKVLRESFEKVHTRTLHYLSQVYLDLEENDKSAVYCYKELNRLLSHNEVTKDLCYMKWAIFAANLSEVFNENFSQMRHFLAAATYILREYENVLKKETEENGETEEILTKWKTFKCIDADIAIHWAKYGLLLLQVSEQKLIEQLESKDEDKELNSEGNLKSEAEDYLKFHTLEEKIEPIMNQITDKYLQGYDDAKLVFLSIQKWLEKVKECYTLEDFTTTHVLLVQYHSQAYYHLVSFEKDEDRQAKMHKRRVDLLENVVKELNPQYYQSACRQLWYSLGGAYTSILDIKLNRLDSAKKKSHAIAKVNRLAENSIKYFQMFINSIEKDAPDEEIVSVPDELVRTQLLCYFNIGRLYSRMISSDKDVILRNTQNSLSAYKHIVDYCKENPAAAEKMKSELSIAKEFTALLPIKMMNL